MASNFTAADVPDQRGKTLTPRAQIPALASRRQAAAAVASNPRLFWLLNSAGVMHAPYGLTEDGFVR